MVTGLLGVLGWTLTFELTKREAALRHARARRERSSLLN